MGLEDRFAIFFSKGYDRQVISVPWLIGGSICHKYFLIPSLLGICLPTRCRHTSSRKASSDCPYFHKKPLILILSWEYPLPTTPGGDLTSLRSEVVSFCCTSGCCIFIVHTIFPPWSPPGIMTSLGIAPILLMSFGLCPLGQHFLQSPSSHHVSHLLFHDCIILGPVHCCLIESAVETFGAVLVLIFPIFLASVNLQGVVY